jgi:hypothetical protein
MFLLVIMATAAIALCDDVSFAVPVPPTESVPAFTSIVVAPDTWSRECNQAIIDTWREQVDERSSRLQQHSHQRIPLPRTILPRQRINSNREALDHAPQWGAELVAWGKTDWKQHDTGGYDAWIEWTIVDARSGNVVTTFELRPSLTLGGVMAVLRPSLDDYCVDLSLGLVESILPSVRYEGYSLAVDSRIVAEQDQFRKGDVDSLYIALRDLYRLDPRDPAVQFNLGVIEEIKGDLEQAEMHYQQAHGVHRSLLRGAERRLRVRRQEVRILEEAGYSWQKSAFNGLQEISLLNGDNSDDSTLLFIESSPPGAAVFIGTKEYGKTPIEVTGLPIGAALVTLVLENYAPGSASVNLEPGVPSEVSVNLEQSRGGARIQALPGSRVIVGGAPFEVDSSGVLEIDDLAVGNYSFRVEAKHHSPVQGNIIVRTSEVTTHRVEQAIAPSSILVRSVVDGASLRIDGQDQTSSLGAEVLYPPGRHSIEVSAPHYESERFEIELAPGQDERLIVNLERTKCDLTLRVSPSDAGVTIDGVHHQAQEQHFLRGVSAGAHRINAYHDDFFPLELDVEFSADCTQPETIFLLPRPGRMLVVSQPLAAEVLVDGRVVGSTPFTGEVPAGEATITVRKPGFSNVEREMDILPNRDHRVNVVLEAE